MSNLEKKILFLVKEEMKIVELPTIIPNYSYNKLYKKLANKITNQIKNSKSI